MSAQPYTLPEVLGILGSLDKTHGEGLSPNLYIEVERRLIATVLFLGRVIPDVGPDSKLGLLASGEAARIVAKDMALVDGFGVGCTGYPECPANGPDGCHFKGEYGITCDEAAMGARMPLTDGLDTAPYGLEYGGYDARRVNWPRLLERIISSTYNAIFYGSLLVAAKLLGVM